MSSRIQGKILGLSLAKQANVSTIAASFLRFKQLNAELSSPQFTTESDAPEVGKGNEFASAAGVFPVAFTPSGSIEKYASAEFNAWAWTYGLGSVVQTGTTPNYIYTVTPMDPGTSLELPYASIVEQLAEGGGNSIDNAYLGVAIEEVSTTISYGPGRVSAKTMVSWAGTGKLTTPSGVTVPALQSEKGLLGASAAVTINGVDYVANKSILSCTIGWKNNLLLNEGFFPGSGTQNGAAIRGRIEYGVRTPSLVFKARLLTSSAEYAKLIALTTGSAVISITFDSNNLSQWTFTQVAFASVVNGETSGIADVTVTCTPMFNSTILTGVFKCGITGICQ